jgi:hypothetical protein
MKQNYFIVSLILFVAPLFTQAQVVNGNFENIKPNFLPSNWGMTFLQEAGFNPETGESFGDQIQFFWCFPSMVYASTEAKTGQYAMEISNAYNWTKGSVVPGVAAIFNDPEQDGPGWNPGVPVLPGNSIALLGFDYKFLPAGDDIAEASLQITDELGNELGRASVTISGTNNTYAYIYTPVNISQAGTPAFMYISFNMAKNGSTPTFGSRLLIDNVIVNFSSLIVSENQLGPKIYPTLVDTQLNIIPDGFAEKITYKIINSEGRVVKESNVNQNSSEVYTMDLSNLSSGMYFLNLQDETKNSTKKFIKK